MKNILIELINELYNANYKVKNIILFQIIKYLVNNYTDDLLFEVIELSIYCLQQDKFVEAKRLIEIINLNQNYDFSSLLKLHNNNSKRNLFKFYRSTNQKDLADNFFKFIDRNKNNTMKILCILSFNKNGYMRYNALVELKNYDFNLTMPYFLLRVNDWVDLISNYATKIVIDNLTCQFNDGYFSSIITIEKIKKYERQKLNTYHIELELNDYLLKSDSTKLIYAFQRENNIKCKRILLEYLIKKDDVLVVNFLKKYQHHDNYINSKINSYLEKKLTKNDFFIYLKNSKHPYQAFIYINEIHDIEKIIPYIYHDSLSVQRHARYVLSNYGKTISINDYKNELSKKNYKKRNIINGLIDISHNLDYEMLNQFLNDKDNYVRKLAFIKLCKMQLIDMINAKSFLETNLSHYERKILIKYKIKLDINELINLYQIKNENLNIIYLIEEYSNWDAFEGLLTLLNNVKNDRHKDVIIQSIKRWDERFKKSNLPLTNDQKTRISDLINKLDNEILIN
ncbi:MAG: hypothetical protein K0Q49_2427 [Haloplasmataceae bacterium]|nr:hypothetical protein [Haloplasmataceae bacterium]